MANVLLINPSSRGFYKGSPVEEAAPLNPVLCLAILASSLKKKGHKVKALDFNLKEVDEQFFIKTLNEFKPEYICFTFVTPLFPIIQNLAKIAKNMNKKVVIIGGGPHSSSMPEDVLKESEIDITVIGEGDIVITEVIENGAQNVKGVSFKKEGKIILNGKKDLIQDLDTLPFPDWSIFNLEKYKNSSHLVSKKSPLGFLETSRGCIFDCCYCNKVMLGRSFRAKSVKRVVEEIKYMLNQGFKELLLVDDGFTTDIKRAHKICHLIIKEGLKFPWTLTNGIRVDRVTPEIFFDLKKAGCYKVAFGIESGDESVLKDIGKYTRLEQVKDAVKWANKAGIETLGSFMIGLPLDTEKTMQKTIDFAKQLDISVAKFTITIPYPGTRLFDDYSSKNLIKSTNWGYYDAYKPNELYDHPNLDWDVIYRYHKKAFREFYFRPKYILKRIINSGIRQGTLFNDIKFFLKVKW